jgi:hypothetical protein
MIQSILFSVSNKGTYLFESNQLTDVMLLN